MRDKNTTLTTSEVSIEIPKEFSIDEVFPELNQCGMPMVGSPVCRSCTAQLKKWPARKSICPSCKTELWPRTRPNDSVRVLCSTNEKDIIEKAWRVRSRVSNLIERFGEEFWKIKAEMESKLSRWTWERLNDLEWSLLNKQAIEYSQNAGWGSYRNVKFRQAEILVDDGRLSDGLNTFLTVLILDLNMTTLDRRQLPNDLPEQELREIFPDDLAPLIAPGLIAIIENIANRIGENRQQLQERFINTTQTETVRLKLPIKNLEAWKLVVQHFS